MRELQLSYGVKPQYMNPRDTSHEFLKEAIRSLKDNYELSDKDLVVVIAGNFGRRHGATYIEIGTIENLLGHFTLDQKLQ